MRREPCRTPLNAGSRYGTSAATPIVAGAAALLLSEYPDLASQEVYDILRVSADKIEHDADGHSRFYGFGRINLRRAQEEAASRMS